MHTRQNLALILVLAISMVGISYGAGGVLPGDGLSESTAYLIEDLADFDVFADPNNSATYWASGVYTKLTCDPNLTGRPYATAVIASDTDNTDWQFDGIPFEGIFDGNGHIVSNLTIDTAGVGNNYLGLFGKIEGAGAQVKNLGVENINITSGPDSLHLGGLCGYNSYGTITDCYATGSVTGGDDSRHLGGLCGRNYGTITNCYSTGSVIGDDYLGGLCGDNGGTITNCYAAGLVTGDNYLGGLCGYDCSGTITNCFWDVETSGMTTSFGGKGLITEQMKDPQIYAMNGWAENSAWVIDAGQDYPRLAWQQTQGTTIPAAPDISGHFEGDGTEQDPFIAYTAADLDRIATASIYFDQHYVLANDIDMSGRIYEPIGYCRGTGFSGSFDGNHHKIQNLSITGSTYLGCFGAVDSMGSVQNLVLENITITGGDYSCYLGGLCGYNGFGGTITNCYAAGSITGGSDSWAIGGLCGGNGWWNNPGGTITNCYATGSVIGGYVSGHLGGLCGDNNGTISNCYAAGPIAGGYALGGLCGANWGTITNCYATGSVTGSDWLGGLCGGNVGYFSSGTITNCYATGSVTGVWYLGGLCGGNGDEGTITNCYSSGSVTGSDWLGGLCGYNRYTISNCYATGAVTGDNYLGGLCGENYNGTITNCYATGSVISQTGSYYVGGFCGRNYDTITHCFWDVNTGGPDNGLGTPKTTAEMQTESTFTDVGWDFTVVPVWRMPFGVVGYPMLGWQRDIPGDFTGRYGVDLVDLTTIMGAWLSDDTPTANWNEGCDLDGSGMIDIVDLKIFTEHWLCN